MSILQLLAELKAGVADWRTVARQFFPEGSFANGGAMRIAPLGLAYRYDIS
jgi:ADP-ribosylglycohydrolase